MKRTLTSIFNLLLVAFSLTYFSGCVSIIPHQPNLQLVEELGEAAAVQKFAETLNRSTQPRYQGTEVLKDSFKTKQVGVVMGAWYSTHQISSDIQVYFNNISRVEVYDNNVVFIRGIADEILLRATFMNIQDATTLADLLESFKVAKSKQ